MSFNKSWNNCFNSYYTIKSMLNNTNIANLFNFQAGIQRINLYKVLCIRETYLPLKAQKVF